MYRERAAGMYSELPFASAQCLIEVPYNLLQALIFSCISYFMLGFDHTAGAPFCICAPVLLILLSTAAFSICCTDCSRM